MMYNNKNYKDSIKSQFIKDNNAALNINKAQEPYSIKTQDRKDVPTANVNLNKEDLSNLFNVLMRAATGRGVININGGIHIRIDKVVITEHK